MANTLKKFYMVRLEGGTWEPRIKFSNLTKVMKVAHEMAQHHGKKAYVIQSLSCVEIVDGKPVWTDQTPER